MAPSIASAPSAPSTAVALCVAVPLWAVTALAFAFLCWTVAKALGALTALAVAGMFGASPDGLRRHLRFEAAPLTVAALALDGAACAGAYCFPAVRALPGAGQAALLGALACGAPLAAALRVRATGRSAEERPAAGRPAAGC